MRGGDYACMVCQRLLVPGYEAYLARHADTIMTRGPLVSDDGEMQVGSVLLLDVPNMDAARAFIEKEPFYSNGVYQEINFHRWCFGRVMDRFKQ